MRQAANFLSHTRRSPGPRRADASAGQDFFLLAYDSLLKAAKNASLTRDQRLHTAAEIVFLSRLRRILAIRCFSYCFSGKNS
jgi:hypothetical protein